MTLKWNCIWTDIYFTISHIYEFFYVCDSFFGVDVMLQSANNIKIDMELSGNILLLFQLLLTVQVQ